MLNSNADPFDDFKNIPQLGKKKPHPGPEFTSFQPAAYSLLSHQRDNPFVQHVALERQTKVKTNSKGKKYSPTGNLLKAAGVQRGFPDLAVYQSRGPYFGLAIELKVKGGTVTDAQYYVLSWLERAGWLCFIAWNIDAVDQIAKYYWSLPLNTEYELKNKEKVSNDAKSTA